MFFFYDTDSTLLYHYRHHLTQHDAFPMLSRGQLTQTRAEAFVLGRNIASTPGKVVFETELFQLIQYNPTTKEVFRKPLLIFPPWINRFYILDLSPEKSFIRWAVEQGHTVFIVP